MTRQPMPPETARIEPVFGYDLGTETSGPGAVGAAPDPADYLVRGADMAKPTCSIEGCENPHEARGWCQKHYRRWTTHGDPLTDRPPQRTPESVATFHRLLALETDECILWPYHVDRNGYGRLSMDGRSRKVHRLACLLTHGQPPTPSHDNAAHSCRNRHCFNPRHLRWATQAENMADTITDGTRARGERCGSAKLTEEDVRRIRALLAEGRTQVAVAAEVGISRQAVAAIAHGETWGWLS